MMQDNKSGSGVLTEDAKVKVKAAAEMYPFRCKSSVS